VLAAAAVQITEPTTPLDACQWQRRLRDLVEPALDKSLEVGADNKVTAVVAAENPATLSDLVRSARELERALQDAGLELDAGGLSFDLAERGENASSDNAASGKSSGRGEGGGETLAQQPVSRPFGLESWRGARVDVMA